MGGWEPRGLGEQARGWTPHWTGLANPPLPPGRGSAEAAGGGGGPTPDPLVPPTQGQGSPEPQSTSDRHPSPLSGDTVLLSLVGHWLIPLSPQGRVQDPLSPQLGASREPLR